MRRVWLLLLALMLPLQAAWAVTHGYAHDASAGAHERIAAPASDDAAEPGSAAIHKADAKGHGCCDMAHSCHGSPSIVSALPLQIEADSRKFLIPSSQAPVRREMVSRHERPQWLPA
jgi:hypothetical protein